MLRRRKFLTSSQCHHGVTGPTKGEMVYESTSLLLFLLPARGKKRPFFIIAGKRIISRWFGPVQGRLHTPHPDLDRFVKPLEEDGFTNCSPDDSVVKV